MKHSSMTVAIPLHNERLAPLIGVTSTSENPVVILESEDGAIEVPKVGSRQVQSPAGFGDPRLACM